MKVLIEVTDGVYRREDCPAFDEYDKDMLWVFHFEGGGWNSVMAKTKKVAIEKVQEKYGDGNFNPIIDSVHVATKKEEQNLLSMFY